jgi:chromobox protein 1
MSEEYIVEEVIGKRLNPKGKTQYLIKWEGYSVEESTWEPLENLMNIKSLIKIYEDKSKKKQTLETLPNMQDEINKNTVNKSENDNTNKTKSVYEIIQSLGVLIPSTIITARQIDGHIYCLVDFLQTGPEKIRPVYVPSHLLKEAYPHTLIDFYESKIRFVTVAKKK